MVAKGSPDWLPSGWTAQYKVQKTGRKIRFYTNLESGKSFYSKDEVIGCIKRIQSQPTSRHIKTQSGDSPVQLTVKTNEYPEWLPDGWKVESRTRMSGSNVGGVYKCYIDPVTDNRFYSKPEVFRYLRTGKNKSCTLKERKTGNTSSRSQVVIEHYKDEDLPPGWIKEIRIKEKTDGIRKDPFFIDPKSRYVFRSKKDVLRYLETGEISRHAFKTREGGDSDHELINDKVLQPSTAKGRKLEHSAATPLPQPLADVVGKEMPTESSSELPRDQILQLGKRQRRNVSSKLKDASVPPVETVEEIALSEEVVRESEIDGKSHSGPRGVEKPALMGQRDQILQSGKRQRRNISSKLKDASVPLVETVEEIALSEEVVRESEIEEKSHLGPRGVEKPVFMGQRDQIPQLGKRQRRNVSSKLKDASVPPVETVEAIALSEEVVRESEIEEKSHSGPRGVAKPVFMGQRDQIPQLGKRQRRNVSSKLKEASVPPVETVEEIALSEEVVRESEIEEKSHSGPRGVEKLAFMSQQDQILQLGKRQPRNVSSKLKDASVPPVETVQEIALSQEVVRESEIEEKSDGSSASPKSDHPEGKETERISSDELDHEKVLLEAEKLGSSKIDLATPENTPVPTTTSKLEQEKIVISDMTEKADANGEKSKMRSFKKKKEINLPRRSSSRLAGFEPESVPKAETKEVPQGSNRNSFTEVSPDARITVNVEADQAETKEVSQASNRNNFTEVSPDAGITVNVEADQAETKEVPQASNRNSFTEVSPDAGITVNVEADQACQQLNVRPERENKDCVSNLEDIPLQENPSNERKTPLECGLDVPEVKIQRVQTEKKDDGKMEGHLSDPIADFWSDPCLEFAIKTLTGALPMENATTTDGPVSNPTVDFLQGQSLVKPVENATTTDGPVSNPTVDGPVSNPTVDFLQEQSLVKKGSGSRVNKRTQGNQKLKNKKELTSNLQSPSFNNEPKPELASNMISFEQANHHSNEAVLSFNLSDGGIFGEPQPKNEQCQTSCQILPPSEVYHPPPEVNSEQSNMTNACHGSNIMALDDQHQQLQMNNHTSSEASLSFPFGDSWADPCLDFAFKTLTGAIPIDDSLEIQSFFEEQLESSRSQKESSAALPDFGSPNLFQNDISSHFDGPEKPVSAQHLSLDPLLSVGNGSLPSCSGFNSQQQPCVDRNRSFKGR